MRGGINQEVNTGKTSVHDRKETNEKAIQVTEHFAETSGIHGIGHIIRRSKLGGIIWSIICLASLGNFNFSLLWIKFEFFKLVKCRK